MKIVVEDDHHPETSLRTDLWGRFFLLRDLRVLRV